ncbi:hypothetical protein TRICI_006276 [Trichomonascus ciferrii]|uniref:RING-type domain-containing protein n=1 Tax=Trichomonascus ciferrii TaxID=44093 RepID=A0A642UQN3_9ASCO|nr:hypothetical protein TRICI_006276 [Trichomonascus ciferrii]
MQVNSTTLYWANRHSNGFQFKGLMYIPLIGYDCYQSNSGYVYPDGRFHIEDLPTGLRRIALAPARSENCFLSYVHQAYKDNATAAILFNDTMCSNPPYDLTQDWHLPLSVLAVKEEVGVSILNTMVAVHDNSDDPSVVFRVGARLEYIPGRSVSKDVLGSFFLTLVIALLGCSFLVAHMIGQVQKCRLQRRVRNGEVNLEELGVKRLRIPPEILDTFPVRIYDKLLSQSDEAENRLRNRLSSDTIESYIALNYQDECAICLDEFEVGKSEVRILPCRHLFHPECVDRYLLCRSSLCPLCKTSCLPSGYLPPGVRITYNTIRRERELRQARRRNQPRSTPLSPESNDSTSFWNRMRGRLRPHRTHVIELTAFNDLHPDSTHHENQPPPSSHIPTQEEEDEQFRQHPLWKRTLQTLFPF